MSMQIAPVCKISCIVLMIACLQLPAQAQQPDSSNQKRTIDTAAQKRTIVNYLKRQTGLFGKLASNLVGDTVASDQESTAPVRNDLSFKPYQGKIIRNIAIQRLDFGTQITDTAHNFKNTFTNLANDFHHKSREFVIRNNLFFKTGDELQPYLLADNERHLRDQPYIQDVKFIIIPLYQSDSVDILVRTKDVLSIGGSIELYNTQAAEMTIKEENLAGSGNTVLFGMLYDQTRYKHAGYAGQYTYRNIGGSFIDGSVGYSDYGNTLNAYRKEEQNYYIRFIKPLINPYTKLTYSIEAANHKSQNMFWSDSLYKSDIRYHYFNYDAWIGWNTGATKIAATGNEDDRMRTLVSLRYFKQRFLEIPDRFLTQYFYIYNDMMGVLGAVSIFKQNFYKAKYFYGFGRNEDVPEGIDMTLTAGWVNRQNVNQPYAGLDLRRYFFTGNKAYYNFSFRSGAYWGSRRPEDFNLLVSMQHYTRLKELGTHWKQRSLITASITGQFNAVFNPPLSLQSNFGLDEWRNSRPADGDFRATLKYESVFFSPITFVNFHFAPFVFGNLSAITPVKQNISKTDLYSSIGGGIRTRNESLIFGTFELKVYYYPRKTFTGDTWRIETNTGIRFKYNTQSIRRPSIINVN
ncbi:MAG: hypothetical protein QM726_09495 [Chitinophagaceae bacterium]